MATGHDHDTTEMSDVRLVGAVGVNLLLTLAQIVGGVISGSLALVADALHNLNDAASLGIALIARRIGRKPANERRTFGHRRAEVIGALINLTTLVIVGLYLLYQAIMRFFQGQEIDGWIVVIVAAIALVVDLATVALVYSIRQGNLNMKAAFVHKVADSLATVGVIVAGTLIILYEWFFIDLIVTVAISGYILYQGTTMARQTIRILMEGVPEDIDLDAVVREMVNVVGVQDVHHVHIWELDEEHRALEAHVLIDRGDLAEIERIKQDVKEQLEGEFDISHSTLEIELANRSGAVSNHERTTVPRSTT